MANQAHDDQPYRSGYIDRGDHDEDGSEMLSATITFVRPSATAKPI